MLKTVTNTSHFSGIGQFWSLGVHLGIVEVRRMPSLACRSFLTLDEASAPTWRILSLVIPVGTASAIILFQKHAGFDP